MHALERRDSMPVVIRFGRLGDMVLQTPLLHLLHARYGQPCRIITSGAWTRELLRGCPDVSSIWQLRHRHASFLLSPERWRLVLALRRCTGPVYVSEDIARQVAKIRRMLYFANVPAERCVFLPEGTSPPIHWVDRLLRFGSMTPAAFDAWRHPVPANVATAPRLVLGADDRADRDAWLRRHRIAHRTVVLVQPGNKRAMKWGRARREDNKAWPIDNWAELLRGIAATLPQACVLLCGSIDEEPLLRQIQAAAHVGGVNVVTRELPLRRLLSLMETAHSMVSVDTGPSHMAAAVGCPLVVLYGAESRDVWGRRSQSGQPIIELGGPPETNAARGISVERVLTAWRELAAQTRTE
jgi:heptosyltransferase-2/heptosyltransferase-3